MLVFLIGVGEGVTGLGGEGVAVNQLDVLRMACRYQYTLGADDIVNTFHYEKTDAIPSTDLAAANDLRAIAELMYTHILASIPTSVAFIDIALKNITQATLLGTFGWPTFGVGTGAGPKDASQVAALVFGRTALSRVQIRKYIGAMQEPDIANSQIQATALTRYQNFGTEMALNQVQVAGVYRPIAYNTALDRRTGILSTAVSINVVTQRRRSRGRGS